MNETFPKEWQKLLIEQREAKLKQASMVEQHAKALRQEAAALGKLAGIDKASKTD